MTPADSWRYRLAELIGEHRALAENLRHVEGQRRMVRLYAWAVKHRTRRRKKRRQWPGVMLHLGHHVSDRSADYQRLVAEVQCCENAIRWFTNALVRSALLG